MERTNEYYQEETITNGEIEIYYNAQSEDFEGYTHSENFKELQELLPNTPIHKKEGMNDAFTHIETSLDTDLFLCELSLSGFVLPDCEE